MARFDLDSQAFQSLQLAMARFPKNAVNIVNDVLHTEGGPLIEEHIRRLMPVSGAKWKGKKPPAKTAKSLRQENHSLAVTIRTTQNYHYLYFPDDGTNTYRHHGEKYFFLGGAEQQQHEIVTRCINRLVADFEQSL